MKIKKRLKIAVASLAGGSMLIGAAPVLADQLDDLFRVEEEYVQTAQQSQVRVDNLAEETDEIVSEWRDVQEQIQTTQTYIAQIERLIADQEKRIAQLTSDIETATQTKRQITPLMLRMVDGLDQFIELDQPFLMKERRERVANLQNLMDMSDISDSEKFRAVLEAYMIEVNFGRDINAYVGMLQGERRVKFLRVGRTILLYQTEDRSETGIWNKSEGRWEVLDSGFNKDIAQAIRIAEKKEAPDLMTLPIPAPENVQ